MNNPEALKEISLREGVEIAIQEIPYYEVVENVSHLPDKNTFKMKLLVLLTAQGKTLPVEENPAEDNFETIYTLWHEEMLKEFNPENQNNRYEAERHQAHIDPRESERDVA